MRSPIPPAILLLLATWLATLSSEIPQPDTLSAVDRPGTAAGHRTGMRAAKPPGLPPGLSIPDTVDAGITGVSAHDTLKLPFINHGPGTASVDLITIDEESPWLELFPPQGLPPYLTIPPDSIAIFMLVISPLDTGCRLHQIRVAYRDGDEAKNHTIRIMTCGGRPIPVVTPLEVDFGRIRLGEPVSRTVTIMNDGVVPLQIDSIRVRRRLFTATPAAIPTSPLIIPPQETRTVTIQPNVSSTGSFDDTLHILSVGESFLKWVPIHALVVDTELEMPASLDADSIPFGGCMDTTFRIVNTGSESVRISRAELLLPGSSPRVALQIEHPSDSTFLPMDYAVLRLRICGDTIGDWKGSIQVTFDPDLERTVPLLWTVTPPSIRIDTARIEQGEIATLRARLDDVAEGSVNITSYAVRIAFDRNALFPKRVVTGGVERELRYDTTGALLLTGSAITADGPSAELFSIDLRGLSTGRAANAVRILSATVGGAGAITDRTHGVVYIEGCDVGRNLVIGQKLAIRSVVLRDGRLMIDYTAPPGSQPSVRVRDMAGRQLAETSLDPLPGDNPSAAVPFAEPPAGIYAVELEDGDARDVLLFQVLPR